MTGENSKHSNMPAKPVHTPHVRTCNHTKCLFIHCYRFLLNIIFFIIQFK